MKQEEKELLLRDLYSRLPYEVKVLCLRDFNHKWYNLKMVDIRDKVYVTTYEPYANRYVKIEEIKPYLFPLSSMTEEQKIIYGDLCYAVIHSLAWDMQAPLNELVDWLNKNHFDYRGLIPMGLANDAINLNIY